MGFILWGETSVKLVRETKATKRLIHFCNVTKSSGVCFFYFFFCFFDHRSVANAMSLKFEFLECSEILVSRKFSWFLLQCWFFDGRNEYSGHFMRNSIFSAIDGDALLSHAINNMYTIYRMISQRANLICLDRRTLLFFFFFVFLIHFFSSSREERPLQIVRLSKYVQNRNILFYVSWKSAKFVPPIGW